MDLQLGVRSPVAALRSRRLKRRSSRPAPCLSVKGAYQVVEDLEKTARLRRQLVE
ncbi:MAG: hypothetical protein IPP07_24025 [Holophagales bacterium]|nr:hypothetical protein [Holophagales bacterium]